MKNISITFLFVVLFNSCATIGSPEGGEKDETPPEVLEETPMNYTTFFDKKKIEVLFDEYVVTKDIRKELIVSPPLKEFPNVKPSGIARKKLRLTFEDTLKENTTYTFSFGNSIQDFNEGNPLPFYKYVFSTGGYIDSMEVRAKIEDSYEEEIEKGIYLCLYRIDSNYTDSIIFKEKPDYVANFLEETKASITNIRDGKYLMIALEDKNSNLMYDVKVDRIAFLNDEIILPQEEDTLTAEIDISKTGTNTLSNDSLSVKETQGYRDTLYEKSDTNKIEYSIVDIKDSLNSENDTVDNFFYHKLRIFKEVPKFNFLKTEVKEKGKIVFLADGENKKFNIERIYPDSKNDTVTNKNILFENIVYSYTGDTIIYEYNYSADSIGFYIYDDKEIIDTLNIRIRKSLKSVKFEVENLQRGSLNIGEKLTFKTTLPIKSINKEDIKIMKEDTIPLKYKIIVDSITFKKFTIDFETNEKEKYSMEIYPYTVRSVFNDTIEDTLKINLNIKSIEDYGTLKLNIAHTYGDSLYSDVDSLSNDNLIIELFSGKKVLRRKIISFNQKEINFKNILPSKYKIRAIRDKNKNGKWDTGNFLKRIQPEEVKYHGEIEIKAFWDLDQDWEIKWDNNENR